MALRTSSWFLAAVRVPLQRRTHGSLWYTPRIFLNRGPMTMAKSVMLDDIAGSQYSPCHICSVWTCYPANANEHWPHSRMSEPHATILEPVFCSLVRNIYISILLEITCSPLHKGPAIGPVTGLVLFYNPIQLFLCISLSPGISSMHLKLC